MDEQRFQTYIGLIEQMLSCPQGEEGAILQTHGSLVDAGLLAVMGQYADWLESQGNGNAGWLRQFASQLAQTLGIEKATSQGTDAARQFLLETLQLIEEKHFDPQQIYPLWAQQQAQFNPELLVVLPTAAAQVFEGDAERRVFMVAVLITFGNLINQFPLGKRWLNLELGIAAYQQVLTVIAQDAMPVDWATTMNNLALAYKNRIRGNRADNIEQAIDAYRQALTVRTQDTMPVAWAETMNNLALAYKDRIRGDHADNIEQAIDAYHQALKIMTQENLPVDWAQTMMNLANAYVDRIRGDRAQNIEEAINAYQQALTVRTREAMPIEWAQTMSNLAGAYKNRIRGDRAQNIEETISGYRQSLQVMTREALPVEWAKTMMNLANAYQNRIRGDRTDNLEQAIDAYQQSLQVMTREALPVEWAKTMMNLAGAYSDRICGDHADNLEQAITSYQQAMTVMTQEAMPVAWAETMNNLANAYQKRIRGDRADNLEQAITSYQQAMTVRTQEAMPVAWAETMNNLANAYKDRIQGDRAQNIEEAINTYRQALEIFEPKVLPNDCRRTSRLLANLYNEQQRWLEAVAVYDNALQAAELLYQSATLLDSKSGELRETADLPRRAAYALARTGSKDNRQKAVETLERGRARGLSENLDRDRADLTQLQQTHPDLYGQYRDVALQLRSLESQQRDLSTSNQRHSLTPTKLRDTAAALRDQLSQTLTQIRQVEGYADFLAPPSFEDVRAALRSECPLVYLATTTNGSMALIVTVHGTNVMWLDDLIQEKLDASLNAWFTVYEKWVEASQKFQANRSEANRRNYKQAEDDWLEAIDTTTRQLWDVLIGSLVDHLQSKNIGRITLIPTGLLSLLPLHAAWIPDPTQPTGRRYALNQLQITYAPNAKSLTTAQAISDRVHIDSLLAIDNPRNDLPNSSREVQTAVSTFLQPTVLRHHQATIDQVRSQLPNAAIAHFACHGTANLTDPLASGLLMSDGLLTLKDIFALNLAETVGLRLAILSACETGMIGTENADEAISLPTGLLQAGVAAVIASLWSVSDLSTMLLLTRLYDLWRKNGLEPAAALRAAQQWVRDTTNAEKTAYFKTALTAHPNANTPGSTANYLYKQMLLSRPDQRDFAHPFHWAAFSYTGV